MTPEEVRRLAQQAAYVAYPNKEAIVAMSNRPFEFEVTVLVLADEIPLMAREWTTMFDVLATAGIYVIPTDNMSAVLFDVENHRTIQLSDLGGKNNEVLTLTKFTYTLQRPMIPLN